MKVALGVCGGIAAYKAAEIVRLLQDRGVRVQVVMTRAAQEFVRPLTFAALSGEKVITGLFGAGAEEPNIDSAVEHIAVAQSIDALLVAPATADTLAKFANGLADDFLSTLFLATTAPVVVAPAMNVNMWAHEATQANIAKLKQRGVRVVEPGAGYLACGMTGPGRLASNEAIVSAALEALGATQDLAGETVLITAGPTREFVDPVRYISNRSSGKMGYALAEGALRRGAQVILVTGPVALKAPGAAEVIQVETADQMRDAVMANLKRATIAIKTAAVADYKAKQVAGEKIKRAGPMTLALEATADILAEIASVRENQVLVGFAAETQDVLANARGKLERKQLDIIVANDVSKPAIGFDSDRNAVTILTRDGGAIEVPETTKWEVAHRVLDAVVALKQRKAATIRS
ncbi:MAG: bifunctional phosphopantothenoylcysteine decarboxylase/phosphopantothenate--cysteine ligase CoaBC [Candidatus Koribacter versatilis]|uniref:Coenzyme A biosynthesis bifunctional protein CoaBC n=1 Tax=Candidatus Korobacter versatilis TaxID=658062 RepID=A0A932EPU6_9BACT|nr:bifunctional phosphopantothenoylcysteine decarboxylase/phosphopantothenate--cysteine ligase CoaBC [Candidatus Koribacter versatilis]